MSNAINYDSVALVEWKHKMKSVIRAKYTKEQMSSKAIDEYLNNKIKSRLRDEGVYVVNNYTNKTSSLTILKLIDTITTNRLICAGGGCLFLPHGVKRNILIEFIKYIMGGRDEAKAKRRLYQKGTDEWATEDRNQLVFKLIINMLYGCFGYAGFTMFNIFIAEAITTGGRHIISSAINSIESYLGGTLYYVNTNDFYGMIMNVRDDYKSVVKDKPDSLIFKQMADYMQTNYPHKHISEIVADKYIEKCMFVCSTQFILNIRTLFSRMDEDELLYFYFKNNIKEFTDLPAMSTVLSTLVESNGVLNFCEERDYKDDTCRMLVQWLSEKYTNYVEYNHPIFDRIHKAMYFDKTHSLYSDTDSAFVSLYSFIMSGRKHIGDVRMTDRELTITLANIGLTLLGGLTNRCLYTMAVGKNVDGDARNTVMMKNEYFFLRIMFTDVMKRYLALALLQEGDLLGGGAGKFEISGFDFKKVAVKPFIKKFYNRLCEEDILQAEVIKPIEIFKKIVEFKATIEKSIASGSMEFFNQANVKSIGNYKNPYSIQGICGSTLWNAIYPDRRINLPTDVNIAPIKKMTYPSQNKSGSSTQAITKSPEDYKHLASYAEKHPKTFKAIKDAIYYNEDERIRHMNLTSIAIPKNIDYELSSGVTDLIDSASIINKTLTLFLPVAVQIGLKSLPYSTTASHISNIIEM